MRKAKNDKIKIQKQQLSARLTIFLQRHNLSKSDWHGQWQKIR